MLRNAMAVVMVAGVIGLVAPAGASATTGGCGTGTAANAGSVSCQFFLVCPYVQCSFSAHLRVDGLGVVGGTITATKPPGVPTDVLFGDGYHEATTSLSDSCTHLLGCDAAIGAPLTNSASGSIGWYMQVTCTASGPAVLEHAACTAEAQQAY